MEWGVEKIVALMSGIGGTGLIGYLAGRKTEKAKTKGVEIDNFDKIQQMYGKSLDDLNKRIDDAAAAHNEQMKLMEQRHEGQVNSLRTQILGLKSELQKCKDQYLNG